MPKSPADPSRARVGLLRRIKKWLLLEKESHPGTVPPEGATESDEIALESFPPRASVAAPLGRPFTEFELPEPIFRGIKDAGFERCTPIQERCLPLSLRGQDVAGQAQTGTGKTAAFLITVLDRLLRLKDRETAHPSALIIAPTRELALQIYHDAMVLGGHCGLRMAVAFGGVDYRKQAQELRDGADIVIGTPGRIIDYMKQKVLSTRRVRVLVIDEADRMFDMGFIKDLRYILRRLPPYEKRQSMLFSATLSYRVIELGYEYMNLPEEIYIEPQERTVDTVEQCVYHVGQDQKLPLLLGFLKREAWERILIFCNTKSGVEFLAAKLQGNGYPAEGITGDLHQTQRLRLMGQFKSGELKILVATDVASRGIHVEDISHVINYDVPQDREDYVHRIGRTARAGKAGKAVTLADDKWVWYLQPIETFLGQKIPVVWFEPEWLEEDRAPRVSRRRVRSPVRRETRSHREAKPRPRSGPRTRRGPRPEAPVSARNEARPEPSPPATSETAASPKRRRRRGRRGKPGATVEPAPKAADT